MVAWVDLNHRPRPYQGNAVWFCKNLQLPRGLPNIAEKALISPVVRCSGQNRASVVVSLSHAVGGHLRTTTYFPAMPSAKFSLPGIGSVPSIGSLCRSTGTELTFLFTARFPQFLSLTKSINTPDIEVWPPDCSPQAHGLREDEGAVGNQPPGFRGAAQLASQRVPKPDSRPDSTDSGYGLAKEWIAA